MVIKFLLKSLFISIGQKKRFYYFEIVKVSLLSDSISMASEFRFNNNLIFLFLRDNIKVLYLFFITNLY